MLRSFQLFLLLAVAPPTSAAAALEPCSHERLGERARCGEIEVLEDRSKPDGRKIGLRVLVLPAETDSGREPVFFLAGGPGQAASDLAFFARPLAAVNRSRDFVFVDQRGTGGSNPLICLNGSTEEPQAAFGGLFKPANLSGCLAEWSARAEVELYNTPEVVADLEQVRARLGYQRVVLSGGSGGTRTALVWMRRHPDRVAAALLDGVAPPFFRAPSGMARAAHTALERVVEDCEAQASCKAAFPDLEADFRKLLWLFEGGPVATRIRRDDGTEFPVRMSRGDFAYALRAMLYSSRRIAALPKLIHQTATSGDVSPFAEALWRRDMALRPTLAMGVHFSVYCSEDMPFIDRPRTERLNEGTFLGDYLMEQYGSICDFWPGEPVSSDFLGPTAVDVPTLIFSGYYDPSTPASLGDEVARDLPNSRHVVVRDEAHGAAFNCGREATIRFLDSASLAGLGPICEEVGPIEFETP